MADADYFNRTREILLGYGLGEKPPIRSVAADANETITGVKIVFDLATNEGQYVKPGNVLSLYNPTDATDSYLLYVLSVSTDQVTAIHGYQGSPVTAADALDGAYLEQLSGGMPSAHAVFNAVDIVVNTLLWPHIYNEEEGTFTPDLASRRSEVPADVEVIRDAFQVVGNDLIRVPMSKVYKNQNSTISSTGNFVEYDVVNGTTVYYTYRSRLALADSATYPSLIELCALGASAILAGASRPETQLARSGQDSQARGQAGDVGAILWRDFLQLRDQWADDLARDSVTKIIIDRG